MEKHLTQGFDASQGSEPSQSGFPIFFLASSLNWCLENDGGENEKGWEVGNPAGLVLSSPLLEGSPWAWTEGAD